MEHAKRKTLGFASAMLTALMALALAITLAPERSLAVGPDVSFELVPGESVTWTNTGGAPIENAEVESSSTAECDVAYIGQNVTVTVDRSAQPGQTAGIEVTLTDSTKKYIEIEVVAPTYELDLTAAPAEGGTVSASQYGWTKSGIEIIITATPKDGYEFAEWEGPKGSIENPAEKETRLTTVADDMSVVAVFNAIHKVIVTSGANGKASATPTEAAVGKEVTLTATPDEGYEFDKWEAPEGVTIENNKFTMPANDAEVKATFKKKEAVAYKVSVSADPAEGGTASASVEAAEAGTTVKLSYTPADRSWEFVEWKTEAEGVTIKDDSFTMPASDVAVTAVFQKKVDPVTTFAITYDANGGTGTMDKQEAEAGATVTLTANAFKRDGYTFNGWNTAKDGSGTAYKDKAEVKVDSDMTLYAQWTKNSANKAPKTGDGSGTLVAVLSATAIAALCALARIARKHDYLHDHLPLS